MLSGAEAGLTLPAASVAVAVKTCVPSARMVGTVKVQVSPVGSDAPASGVVNAVPGVQVVLLGSPNDRETCDHVQQHAGAARAAMLNLAGKTSLDDAIALLARAGAVVSNDSGLLHIASALNRPVVALYGSTDPDYAPPLSEVARTVSLRLECSPCRKRECPLGHHDCMNRMSVERVWSELAPILMPARDNAVRA